MSGLIGFILGITIATIVYTKKIDILNIKLTQIIKKLNTVNKVIENHDIYATKVK